jgi:hypothetical protein
MKSRIVFVMILVFFVLCLKNAVACGQITTWNEAYASYLGFVPEDVTVKNDPMKSPVSNRQITSFRATTSSWNVSKENPWHLNVTIFSYQNAEEAAADFPSMKPAKPDYTFIDNEKDFYAYYQCIVWQEFGLGGVYQSFIISISGWGETKNLEVDALRSEFMALFSNSKTLIDYVCGLVPVNHAPEIRMTPQPGKGYPFEFSILRGEGFQIEIHDEDGIKGENSNWKLDWSKFKVFVNGRDQTVHFLDTIINQKLLYGWNEESGKTLILSIRPDPQKLMSEHNLFNIKDNGTYQIEFEICDTDGMCGSSKQDIVFNPIIVITNKFKYSPYWVIVTDGVYFGNIGKQCKTKVFAALYNPLMNSFWTYKYSVNQSWYKDEFIYIFENSDLPTGLFPLTGFNFFAISDTKMTIEEVLASYLAIGFNTEDQFCLDWAPIE